MDKNNKGTICIHGGGKSDQYKSVNTPIYTSTAYGYLDTEQRIYPRYFNTPNQESVIQKLMQLENAESGLVFSSGMAAISTVLLTLLNKGDHVIFQNGLYGGTIHFISQDFERLGISYTILSDNSIESFKNAIGDNTKAVYIETPSNPLLSVIDLEAIHGLCADNGLISVIDNTFASPINQNPINWGIDIVIHSATKYLGGHSDISAGVVLSKSKLIDEVRKTALNLGGSLDAQTCYLLERSIKTLSVRVEKQNENASKISGYLQGNPHIDKVYYPGLKDHPGHEIAKKQMTGYGGMLSFEMKSGENQKFLHTLQLIKPALSLGGVESTICDPATTSHRHLSKEQRIKSGISDKLLRLSVGIENVDDIICDLDQAISELVKV